METTDDGPVLVLSDVHLGFKDESAKRFKAFVEYLTEWVDGKKPTIETGETLAAPQKIILLGDILDLWISRDSNTVRPYQQGFNPLGSLTALDREIAYVAGNHDWITRRSAGTYHPRFGTKPVTVYPDYYDPYGHGSDYPWDGVPIGNQRYLFMHGHQFDVVFSKESLLRFGDFIGFSSASADEMRPFKVLGALIFCLTLGVALSPLIINWLPSFFTVLAALMQNPALAVITLFLGWLVAVIISVGVLWLFNTLEKQHYHSRRSVRQSLGGAGQTLGRGCPNTIQRLVGTYGFRRVEPQLNASIIVFGHTHVPCIDTYTPKGRPKKLLVNAGSWTHTEGGNDTFVYIDTHGPRLLRWNGDGSVSQIDSSLE